MTHSNRSVMAFNLSYLFDQHDVLRVAMERLLEWLEGDKIRPLPTTTIPFHQVAESHRRLESGQTVGKLVLTMPG